MINHIPSHRPERQEGASRGERSKPANVPKDNQFRKTMDKRSKKEEEEEEFGVSETPEESPSLFDLSRSTKMKSKTPQMSQTPHKGVSEEGSSLSKPNSSFVEAKSEVGESEDLIEESPDLSEGLEGEEALTQEMKKKQSSSLKQVREGQESGVLDKVKGPKEKTSEKSIESSSSSKKKSGSKVEEMKPEMMGGVGGPIQEVGLHSEKVQDSRVTSTSTISEIANQIVDGIQEMRKGDEMKTMVTLKHPPILAGATITLTASDHARREFNISFANLSQHGKVFLDLQLQEVSLIQKLGEKQIMVHQLTTSTAKETLISVGEAQASKDRNDQQQQEEQQQQQRQRRQFFEPDEEAEG